ncbi:hypothetical protein [Micromonospora echinofusca]|uniref:Uncharacterized protein n=1 Tax=Micromonospora echinofusca TaxID=47858 RepID=A0ABS3VML3_MICEH|nr:hypothetical protein [Micromonospora echinofusca]MBO4205779.1 hypothetical protein [Micromonospora echinofusca]
MGETRNRMLVITEEQGNYPDGRIPDLETDEKACEDIVGRISGLLPPDRVGEVLGTLVNWSASTLPPAQVFGTWAEAVTAATRYVQGDVRTVIDPQGRRDRSHQVDSQLGTAIRSTGRTDDLRIVQRDRSRRWANCGMAAFQIREQLAAHGGEPVLRARHTYQSGQGDDLRQTLRGLPATVETVLLLDCQFPQVHNFVIEAHADGRRYLAQGYQGSYFAQWWMGAEDGYSGEPPVGITGLRDRYGRGRPISPDDYRSLLDGLADTLAGDWRHVAERWRTLPFNPDPQEVDGIGRRAGTPSCTVEVYELTRPALARAALGGVPDVSLSELAVRRIGGD